MKRLFKIVINDEDLTGMDAISLVEEAAVQRNFLKFEEAKKIVFQNLDEEKHIITGVVALADTPIYRYDDYNGEYWVVFDKYTIRKMVEKYSKLNLFNRVNLQHDDDNFVNDIYMIESYIIDKERGILPIEFNDVTDGSWIISYKVNNIDLWEEIKSSGKLNGYSLQGIFQLEQVFSSQKYNNNPIIDKLKELMKFNKLSLRNLILRFQDIDTDKGILTIDGELEVGAAAFVGEEVAEDGEYAIEGKVIVIADGKVAEIREVKVEEPVEDVVIEEEAEDEKDEIIVVEEPVEDEKDARIAELEARIAELEAENAELKGKVAEQEEQMKMSVEKMAAEKKEIEKTVVKKSIYSAFNKK